MKLLELNFEGLGFK